ncbi:hypothetical protein SAY86_023479 [Trapa natans]|uniref:NAC domain-containing protein n=1 Tax=Trapa natans TaxID=22666 RepID=A0AAN7LVU1_TRANT|nr:hypothetical protein SAY86_023479 [Trapa natans]
MAIPATMDIDEEKNSKGGHGEHDDDEHDHDMVMPGFRFHPTEEELVEFYLRRKVEGKRFNVELISYLDLYRYDPWELPALATIGEKEWYFYVPRDRKYRNGDRPNRVTTSGYWKATGADRMIRGENSRSIGLKKTLVFYTGKAPKGVRTSWIMNEYRLPHHETEFYQKAEISLCRVYKRAGVGDYSNPTSHLLPQPLPATRAASSGGSSRDWDINGRQKQAASQQQRAFSSNLDVLKGSTQLMPAPPLLHHHHNHAVEADHRHHLGEGSSSAVALSLTPRPHHQPMNLNYRSSTGIGNYENYNQHPKMSLVQQQQPAPSSSGSTIASAASLQDDLHRLVNYHTTHHHHSSHHISSLLMTPQLQLQLPPQHQQLVARGGALQQPLATAGSFYERAPWEWNPAAPNQDCSSPYQPNMVNPFK